ncbi:MAG: hypothetical protein P8N49_08390 [Opitutales bacterium]|nr:hypothetical protein [Opitutales bacterium]
MPNDKTSSLKWAIDELSKQRLEFENQLSIAQKRDETRELITEVHAQKEALQKRISALEDGLKVSSELVQVPVPNLESDISEINDKLEIAKERLDNLEQEEYFEELGRKLNGKQTQDSSTTSEKVTLGTNDTNNLEKTAALPSSFSSFSESHLPITSEPDFNSPDISDTTASTSTPTATMKPTSSRIQQTVPNTSDAESSRLPEEESDRSTEQATITTNNLSSVPVANLEETAEKLGVEQDFLVEKSIQAVLRMVARNGGKLTFPLEVEQA